MHSHRDSWAPGTASTEHLICPSSAFTGGAVEGLYSDVLILGETGIERKGSNCGYNSDI